MTGQPIAFDLDLSMLPDDVLPFMEAIATECRYQAPALMDGLAWSLERERKRRDAGIAGPVHFKLGAASLPDAYDAMRAALAHAALCVEYARRDTEPPPADGWNAMAKVFLAIHNGIVAAVGPGDLLAYASQLQAFHGNTTHSSN